MVKQIITECDEQLEIVIYKNEKIQLELFSLRFQYL